MRYVVVLLVVLGSTAQAWVPEPKGLCFSKYTHQYQKPPCPKVREYYDVYTKSFVPDTPGQRASDCRLEASKRSLERSQNHLRYLQDFNELGLGGGLAGAVAQRRGYQEMNDNFDQSKKDEEECFAICMT
jgi:hypothetical protein